MMGLRGPVFFGGWYVTYSALTLVPCVLLSALSVALQFYKHTSPLAIFLITFLCQCFVIFVTIVILFLFSSCLPSSVFFFFSFLLSFLTDRKRGRTRGLARGKTRTQVSTQRHTGPKGARRPGQACGLAGPEGVRGRGRAAGGPENGVFEEGPPHARNFG